MFITSQFPGLGFDQFWVSAPEFLEFGQRNRSFDTVGAYTVRAANLGTDVPSRPVTALVTHELMPALGVPPIRGRMFTREDTLPNAEDVAILSYELWQRSFGSHENALGTILDIDGVKTRIVGVMPRGYDVHDQKVELWLPLTLDPVNPGNRGGHFLYLIGRLKPGVTIALARSDLETQLVNWKNVAPNAHVPNTTGHRLRIDPLQDDVIGSVKTALLILQGVVGFVLVIACANLANLLLARADSRQKEFAVRTALGAGRHRMIRQFLTEGVVLSVIGAAIGAFLASAGLRVLLAANPNSIPRSADIVVDPLVLAFTLAIVRSMDPTLPLVNMRTMEDVFAASIARPRFLMQLLAIFAALALLLAAVGTYGILAYSVTERRQEIGIRMALGASRGSVLGLVMGQGLKLTLAGLVIGLGGALALTRLMRTLLFNVRPTDPVTLASVAAFIAVVAIAACFLPARRATLVDPMRVLRQE
jgi:hypothetical protein